MVDAIKLLPVTLPSWPTCEGCLSWSEDYLAVAGGEVVHILVSKNTPTRRRVAGHPQWIVSSLRVNLFQQDQWPDLHPVTLKYLSIGEEQSLSNVVALAWSPTGLSVHRRAVLAVLTSNLILSFWETDGTSELFERTCILNKYLGDPDDSFDSGASRQKLRVRAFVWLPPIKTPAESKWGLQHILVADDSGTLIVLRITKETAAFYGHWQCDTALRYQQSRSRTPELDAHSMSPLQRRLYEQASVTKIRTTPWAVASSPVSGAEGGKTSCAKITVQYGSFSHILNLTAVLSGDHGEPSFSFDHQHHGVHRNGVNQVDTYLPASTADVGQVGLESTQNPNELFKESIQPVQDAFDKTNQLAGHYRVRFWGIAMSSDGSRLAACVTIHPSDMIEYTIPSSEKCTLVFENSQSVVERAAPVARSTKEAQYAILEFALRTLQDGSMSKSKLDWSILLNYFSLSSLIHKPGTQTRSSWDQISVREANRLGHKLVTSAETIGQSSDPTPGSSEECEICGACIPLTSDTSGATCAAGHYFSRCQISFLAIQEPGVSKYCTQCGKEFLNLAKLDALDGPCLAQAMFNEFDVCPYCQAKFRG